MNSEEREARKCETGTSSLVFPISNIPFRPTFLFEFCQFDLLNVGRQLSLLRRHNEPKHGVDQLHHYVNFPIVLVNLALDMFQVFPSALGYPYASGVVSVLEVHSIASSWGWDCPLSARRVSCAAVTRLPCMTEGNLHVVCN